MQTTQRFSPAELRKVSAFIIRHLVTTGTVSRDELETSANAMEIPSGDSRDWLTRIIGWERGPLIACCEAESMVSNRNGNSVGMPVSLLIAYLASENYVAIDFENQVDTFLLLANYARFELAQADAEAFAKQFMRTYMLGPVAHE